MKNLAEFKRRLKVGVKLKTTYHMHFVGRDENGLPIWGDQDLGVREVSVVQTNSFALKTTKKGGEIVDSWCDYPKARTVKIEEEKITIFQKDTRGSYRYDDNAPMLPVLTYEFV